MIMDWLRRHRVQALEAKAEKHDLRAGKSFRRTGANMRARDRALKDAARSRRKIHDAR